MSFPFISIQAGQFLCGCVLGILYYKILYSLEHGEVGLFDCRIIANASLRQCGFLRSSDMMQQTVNSTPPVRNILVSKIVHVMISSVITQCVSYAVKVSAYIFSVAPKFKNQVLVL